MQPSPADAILDQTTFRKLPSGIRPTRGSGLLRTRIHYVWIREAAGWRIVFPKTLP